MNTYASVHCTTSHDDHRENIISGYAYTHDASFGAFIAAQPIGAEIVSISGRVCRWTGNYATRNGHRVAVLTVLDTKGRDNGLTDITIHCCANVVWTATGHIVDPNGNRGERRFDLWPESLGERRIREAREHVAALRAARLAANA